MFWGRATYLRKGEFIFTQEITQKGFCANIKSILIIWINVFRKELFLVFFI